MCFCLAVFVLAMPASTHCNLLHHLASQLLAAERVQKESHNNDHQHTAVSSQWSQSVVSGLFLLEQQLAHREVTVRRRKVQGFVVAMVSPGGVGLLLEQQPA